MHLENKQGAQLLTDAYLPKRVCGVNAGVTQKLNSNEQLIALRDFAMLNLMLRTGLRTIEVSRADIKDITRKKGRRILKVWGKGHSEKDDFVAVLKRFSPVRPSVISTVFLLFFANPISGSSVAAVFAFQ